MYNKDVQFSFGTSFVQCVKKTLISLNDRLAEQSNSRTGAAAPMPSPGEQVPPKGADVECGR